MGGVETHNRRKGGGGAEGVCADVPVSFPGKVSEGILSSLQLSRASTPCAPSLGKERHAAGLAFPEAFPRERLCRNAVRTHLPNSIWILQADR